MASRRKRLARLRSTSASLSRSRSATPQRIHSSQRPSAARRALLMGLSLEEKRPVSPVRQGAQLVSRTPGGSVNLTGKSIAIENTPCGHVRVAKTVEEPLCGNVLERVEAMDLSEEEAEEVMQSYPWHVQRWLKGLPTVATEGRECSSANPITRSNSAEMNLAKASGTVSVCAANPNSSESMVKVTSAAVVRPSTSGVTATSKPNATGNVNEGSELDSEFDDEFDESPVQRTDPGLGLERDIPDDEDLAEPVRNIINEVERAMDDAADRLPGVLTSFEWTADFESFRGVPEVFSGPAPGPLKDYETPYDAFTDIWSMDFIERIAQETNRYAKQTIDSMKAKGTLKPSSRLHRWKNTDADEILVLFAVYMYMAIDPRTSQDEYWMADDYLEMPKFRRLMSYNRYILLSKFLHFVDNSDVSQDSLQNEGNQLSPKLAKLEPVISHLNKKFSSLYNLEREISIDESLTLFKGRLSWVQTIRTKAARFGIKSYELCESHTGYLYNFQIYTGKSSDNVGTTDFVPSADLGGKTTKIVVDLLKDLENQGHCVTMDNFYNCPALARYLKSLGIDCLGTLRTNRKNMPEDVKVPKNVAKGKIVARHCGDVSVLAWKDSKVVTMISTYHNDETFMGSKANKPLVKPKSVGDYNNTMGGVDLKDQKLSMYLLERKRALKWYVKMFKRLLNVSIHNAFVMTVKSLRRNDKLPMTHREFRYKLAKTLVDKHRRNQPEIGTQVEELTRLRRDIVHEPKYTTGSNSRRRCHICHENGRRKLVHSQCVTCDEFLCFENCWKDWHSLPKLKSEKPRGRKRSRNEN